MTAAPLFTGNMLEMAGQGYIIQGCNAQGVMGSGLAKAIRDKWPAVYTVYRDHYERYGLSLGEVIPVEVEPGLVVANFITQEFYGKDGKKYASYDAIEEGCKNLLFLLARKKCNIPQKVHVPFIGCGLGGAKWPVVEAIINTHITPKYETRIWSTDGNVPI